MKCGPEWNPVLVVLAVAAALALLAFVSPWAGIVGVTVAFVSLCVWAYVNGI